MEKQKEVLIIIPAYNEAGTIGKVLEKLEQPEIAAFADVLVMNKLGDKKKKTCSCDTCIQFGIWKRSAAWI